MPQLGLESLKPAVPHPRRKRVGRGPASGHGKTSGRGTKGQKARSGGAKGPGFEGGQLPLQRRIPKRGFTNAPFARTWRTVNVGLLDRLPAGTEVTPELLEAKRLVPKGRAPIKILGAGELRVALSVAAHAFSSGARQKIEAAGGTVRVLGGEAGAGTDGRG
jgi:large subunit ribosomal protein L15